MKQQKLTRIVEPINLSPRCWAYSERSGLSIYAAPDGQYSGESVGVLTWGTLRALLHWRDEQSRRRKVARSKKR